MERSPMTTEANEGSCAAANTTAVKPQEILDAVCSRVCERTSGGEVVERVVEELVECRLNRRTELLTGAVKRLKEIQKEISSIEPADQGFTRDGEKVSGTTYNEYQISQLKSLNEELKPLSAAIAAQDFDELSKLGY